MGWHPSAAQSQSIHTSHHPLPCTPSEGYESLSEIRLVSKRKPAVALMLNDTTVREPSFVPGSPDLESSFLERVQTISEGLTSTRWAVKGGGGPGDPQVSPDAQAGWLGGGQPVWSE